MNSAEKLLEKYPDAPVEKTTFELDETNFAAQVNKNTHRNAEGGAIGIVWIGKSAIVLVRRTGLHQGWALIGGTVDNGEEFDKAFVREAKEEAAVDVMVDRLLVLDKRTFVSPSGDSYSMNLAVFEATATVGQTATTTAMARNEELEVGIFETTALPPTMIFKDKARVEMAIASR